jgi:oxygen-dependent protoporphyrinogen oxidase
MKGNSNLISSIEEFVTRRFGAHVAKNIFSAVIHGIYAGDTSQLSVKSCFKGMWDLEQNHGSFFNAMLKSFTKSNSAVVYKSSNPKAQEFMDAVSKESVYSFKGGIQTLTDRLSQVVKDRGVHIIPSECSKLSFKNSEIVVELNSKSLQASLPSSFDHVFSAIPSNNLSQILEPKYSFLKSSLDKIPSVDVSVVNLVYAKSKLPVEGFGFLVPKTENLPILGVVFDSVAFSQGDDAILSVMMGGHNFERYFGDPKTVDKAKLLKIAIDSVTQTLGLSKDNVIDSFVSVHEKCIPQYLVGHEDLLKEIDTLVKCLPISLIGASYRGVSINDCIYNAKLAVEQFSTSVKI